MRALIGQLMPLFLRHLDAYAEIAGEDVREAAARVARRLAALLVAAASAFFALLMLCAWVMIIAWDTPWRAWSAAGLMLGFAAAAAAFAWPALRRGSAPDALFFPRMRRELRRDRELIKRSFDGRREAKSSDEHRAE